MRICVAGPVAMTSKTDTTESYRQELYSLYSDLFKSEEGIRPRWAYTWSIEKLQAAIDRLDETEPELPTSGDGWAFIPAEA